MLDRISAAVILLTGLNDQLNSTLKPHCLAECRSRVANFDDEKDDKGADYHTVVSTIENPWLV